MQALRNKRCIITGGSRGIGLAIAKLFANQGASCFLIGRNEASLTEAVTSLPPISSPALSHGTRAFDVVDRNAWKQLMDDAETVSLPWHLKLWHVMLYVLVCTEHPGLDSRGPSTS